MPVTLSSRKLSVVPEIPAQFAAYRRAFTPKATRNFRLADLLLVHSRDDPAFVQTQLHKRAGKWVLISESPNKQSKRTETVSP